jgi:hypothetical protein
VFSHCVHFKGESGAAKPLCIVQLEEKVDGVAKM